MFDLENLEKLQPRLLTKPELRFLYPEKSANEIKKLERKTIELKLKALPIYKAVVPLFSRDFDSSNQGDDLINRAIGVAGNDAIQATLNGCKIFYRTNQLWVSFYSDWVDYDFILAPKGVKIEVKTVTDNEGYFRVNKTRSHKNKKPDVIISLKGSVIEDKIVYEFMGWVRLSEIKEPKFELDERKDGASFYKCEFNQLHPPVDIEDFLFDLAHEGPSYLDRLSK